MCAPMPPCDALRPIYTPHVPAVRVSRKLVMPPTTSRRASSAGAQMYAAGRRPTEGCFNGQARQVSFRAERTTHSTSPQPRQL